MSEELKVGMTHEIERQTTEEMSAQNVFPHVPHVYATSVMVGHMEAVCAEMVLSHLGEGEQTVGIGMKFSHTAATPLGMKVRFSAKLIEVDGRKLVFEVEGYDEADKIGKATHQRFIIDAEKFNSRVAKKAGT
ncbi:MAG: thioesterase family protein [Deltaproteobacteria bacterium]|jgi:fluoroacetyl-CoA thioesterase|nr:thioesterase family protein [Deltaproteobacteria bacterium]MDX2498657.1 thioesterase family protein [Desulfobacterales bacterium]MBW1971176.1 thioesterase family protein [Deltaproteobacteria bacterium]MBW2157968.1 thioesterase family protein [Deltaproteobacteria bacterium]MBW2198523.1 thioesterase family protein [Deltaproteobacteria bacterium]